MHWEEGELTNLDATNLPSRRSDAPLMCTRVVAHWEGELAVVVRVVHSHWNVLHAGLLVHQRLRECKLEFLPQSFGGIVQMHYPRLAPWPPFVSRIHATIEPPMRLRTSVQNVQVTLPRWLRTDEMRICDAMERTVEEALRSAPQRDRPNLWSLSERCAKSHRSLQGTCAPMLLRMVSPPDSYDSGIFFATRLSEWNDEVFKLYENEFNTDYASKQLGKVLDGYAGVYRVTKSNITCAAIVIYLFDATYSGGMTGLVEMVESVAVATSFQNDHVGWHVYHSICRGILVDRTMPGHRYWVFAQCLKAVKPRTYWESKLDETSLAKSLLLQAKTMHDAFVVEPLATCTIRCREYVNDQYERGS